jgi:hypothetical protein
MSGVCPTTVRVASAPHWMTLPNTCASGRKSNTEPVSFSSSGRINVTDLTSLSTLRWVSSQPFGCPVVPEV